MISLKEALRRVAAELGEDVSWAVVGGLAVSSRIEPRFTRDIDLAILVEDDEAAEDLVYRLRSAGYAVLASVEQEATDRLATVRLFSAEDSGVLIDLLFASSGIEREVVQDAEPLEIASGLVVPVAQTWHLLAMKVLARDDQHRPQDLVDLRNLIANSTDEDLTRARGALDLIRQRGFARQKDLQRDLEELLVRYGSDRSPTRS